MKVMFNEDWGHFLWTRYDNNINVTEETLKTFIYQYKDTCITDFSMNVNGTVSTYPSKTWDSFSDRYLVKEENGEKVDYTNTFAKLAYQLREQNIDMYKIWIDTLNEIGIKPWISIRVNDCHYSQMKNHMWKSSFISKRSDLMRINHRERREYYDYNLDFSKEEAREHLLSYIDETLERYSPYGLELDFTREMYSFYPGGEKEGTKYINEMMHKIKELAKKHFPDRKIPINVLVNGTASSCLALGHDVGYWAENDLIDSVTLLPRWETINFDYEFDLWKRVVNNKVPVGGGLQIMIRPTKVFKDVSSTVEMAYGEASSYIKNGCDFLFLYNFMDITESGIKNTIINNSTRNNLDEILTTIGNEEKLLTKPKRYTLTYDDFTPYWERSHARLPIEFGNGEIQYLKIATGELGENSKLVLAFREDIDVSKISVYINSKKAEFSERGGLDRGILDKDGYIFPITDTDCINGSAIVEIDYPENAMLIYAEITVGI